MSGKELIYDIQQELLREVSSLTFETDDNKVIDKTLAYISGIIDMTNAIIDCFAEAERMGEEKCITH